MHCHNPPAHPLHLARQHVLLGQWRLPRHLLHLLLLLLQPLLLLPLLQLHGELAQPVRQAHPPQLGGVLDGKLRVTGHRGFKLQIHQIEPF